MSFDDQEVDKPRFRLVYRLLPNEVQAVSVEAIAVGPRGLMDVYVQAARRLARLSTDTLTPLVLRDVSGNARVMSPTHPPPATASTDLLIAFAGYERAVLCLSEKTVRNHRIYLETYLQWWHAGHGLAPVATARPGEVAAFLIAEARRGLAPRTRRSELGALRGFYNWLVLSGRAPTNPAAVVPSPRISAPPIEIYTPAESIAILEHTASLSDLRGRQRHAIVATLRHTGMRSGELRTLRRADLDLSAGRALVVGKRSRQRMVLLPPALCPILGQFVARDRPLLPSSPLLLANPHSLVTTPLFGFGMDALAREVELAGLGAGLGGRHYPHKWRHTFATEMVRAGVDIHVVQRLLGHAHISSTVGYTHLALDDLRAAVTAVWGAA